MSLLHPLEQKFDRNCPFFNWQFSHSDDNHLSKSELPLVTDDILALKISVHCLQ